MSGGRWDYLQYRFSDVVDDINNMVDKNGLEKTKEEIEAEDWRDPDWYKKYPEDKFHYKYPDDVIEELKKGARIIQEAQIYMQRIDRLLSSDDGNDTFLKRLKDDLNKLQ
jgi:hypothetical protein